MTGSIVAIVNARAGGATEAQQQEALAARIQAALPAVRVVFAGENDDVTALAREAVAQGAGMVIAAGGDGTINSVATAVAGSDAMLGVLPMGTLNHFAKDLGIPADPDAALAVIAAGHVAPVDAGEVNGRVFINNSALGLYPGIVGLTERAASSRPRHFKRLTRMLRLVAATARVLSRYHLLRIRIESQGKQMARTTPAVFIGNNEYTMEGLKAGTRQRLDAGQLMVVIAHQRRALPLLWSGLRRLAGLRRPEDFERVTVTEARIETPHRHLDVTLDGELVRLEAPLHYRIRPGALRVAVPAPD